MSFKRNNTELVLWSSTIYFDEYRDYISKELKPKDVMFKDYIDKNFMEVRNRLKEPNEQKLETIKEKLNSPSDGCIVCCIYVEQTPYAEGNVAESIRCKKVGYNYKSIIEDNIDKSNDYEMYISKNTGREPPDFDYHTTLYTKDCIKYCIYREFNEDIMECSANEIIEDVNNGTLSENIMIDKFTKPIGDKILELLDISKDKVNSKATMYHDK